MPHAGRDPAHGHSELLGDLGEDVLTTGGIGIATGKVDVVAGDDEAILALVEADGRAQDALVDRGILRPGVADMDLQRLRPAHLSGRAACRSRWRGPHRRVGGCRARRGRRCRSRARSPGRHGAGRPPRRSCSRAASRRNPEGPREASGPPCARRWMMPCWAHRYCAPISSPTWAQPVCSAARSSRVRQSANGRRSSGASASRSTPSPAETSAGDPPRPRTTEARCTKAPAR